MHGQVIRRPTMDAALTVLPLPHLFSMTAPGGIGAEESLQDVRYQFCGFGNGFAMLPAVLDRIGIDLLLVKWPPDLGPLD
jgi:hypothetical protein